MSRIAIRVASALCSFAALLSAACLALLLVPLPAVAQTTSGTAATGQTLYNTFCDGCHGATVGSSSPAIKNAANAGGLINEVMGNGMGGYNTGSFTSTQENDIAAYISQQISESSPSGVAVAHNSAGTLISMTNIYANTAYGPITKGIFSSGATRGSVTFSTSGSTIRATYTPDTGQCGTDTVYYRGANASNVLKTNLRSFSVDIADPAAPVISSAIAKTSTVGVATAYTITTTGGTPLSWGATSIPTGLSRSNNVISGTPTTAGTFNSTVYAYNCLAGNLTGHSDSQAVTWTVNKGSQTITFPAQASQTYPVASFAISPVATSNSGLAITYSSLTTGVCTVLGTTVTRVTAGTCTIAANQAGNANWFAASQVTRNIIINKAAQSITFPVQTTASRPYSPSGVFAVSPVATASSGLAVTYDSNTPAVCTMPGTVSTTVTIVAAGTCTIGANQAGDVNYFSASEATRSVTITATVPQPPTGVAGTGANAQAVIDFTPPSNTGGVPILDYTATCTANLQTTRTGTAASPPVTVLSMTNGVQYSCTVTARNAAGSSAASAATLVTPTTAPTFTSLNNATFTVNAAGTFNVSATGSPTPTITHTSGALPSGVTFTSGSGSGVLAGTPALGTVGSYPLTFTASNPATVMQSFTLTVQKASQTITFGALADRPMSPAPFSVSATTT